MVGPRSRTLRAGLRGDRGDETGPRRVSGAVSWPDASFFFVDEIETNGRGAGQACPSAPDMRTSSPIRGELREEIVMFSLLAGDKIREDGSGVAEGTDTRRPSPSVSADTSTRSPTGGRRTPETTEQAASWRGPPPKLIVEGESCYPRTPSKSADSVHRRRGRAYSWPGISHMRGGRRRRGHPSR